MNKISAIIHTYNSEKYLDECLNALKSLDEILICDMYSTDKTVEIAQKYGAKIIYTENIGYADPVRNWAIQQAKYDWILVVDSDEIVSDEFIEYIKNEINTDNYADVYKVAFKAIYFGKFIKHKYPDFQARFFRKGYVEWKNGVHNGSVCSGNIKCLPDNNLNLAFNHYNYDSIEHFVRKMNIYTTLEVDNLINKHTNSTFFKIATRGFFGFFDNYFLKGAYKDGMHGFIISVLVGIYKFLAIAKLWEQNLKYKIVPSEEYINLYNIDEE